MKNLTNGKPNSIAVGVEQRGSWLVWLIGPMWRGVLPSYFLWDEGVAANVGRCVPGAIAKHVDSGTASYNRYCTMIDSTLCLIIMIAMSSLVRVRACVRAC